MNSHTQLTKALIWTAVLPLLSVLTACSQSASSDTVSSTSSRSAPDLKRFYEQELTFGPCESYATSTTEKELFATHGSVQCAHLLVPLVYDKPSGDTANIAVARVPAQGRQRVGSLLLNSGGPGGPGLAFAVTTASALAATKSQVVERFDLIGFDPRGVGASTPTIDCATDEQRDRGGALPFAIYPGAWTEQDSRQLVRRCAERSGGDKALASVGTRDVARDMDVLRAVLNDEKLSYLGQSYGTRLGAVYAEMFPQKVRALVLDGAIDPNLGTTQRRVVQYAAFQQSFDKMAAFCAESPDCPLGTDPKRASGTFQSIVRPLINHPVPAGPGRQMSYNAAIDGTIAGLYDAKAWPFVIKGIAEVKAGRGDLLTKIGDALSGRGADGHWSNFLEVNFAINCMDEQRRTPQQETQLRQDIYRAAPFLNAGDKAEPIRDACELWPAQPTLTYPYANTVKGLPETLTISITGDNTTPYQSGVELAKTLHGALLTVQGEQHTVAATAQSDCVNRVVTGYLVNLLPPSTGSRCTL